MRSNIAKIVLPLFIFLLLSLSLSPAVSAQGTGLRKLYQETLKDAASKSGLAASIAAMKEARKDALSDFKVKACEARQDAIKKRSEQMVKRAMNQEDVFTKIATRVEEFYQTKVVAQGKTVPNYAALVADIAAKKAALSPLLIKVQTDAANFSCAKDHPADQMKLFKQDMEAVIAGLKDYKTSVRNLIVAVKTAVGAEKSSTGSAVPNLKQ